MKIKGVNKKTVLNIILPVIVIAGVLLIGEVRHKVFKSKIAEQPVFTTGVIQSVKYRSKHGYVVTYSFDIDYRFITSAVSGDRYQSVRNFLIGKSFPIVYNRNKPEYNRMLILPEDFKEYNIAFPDSLGWIRKYME